MTLQGWLRLKVSSPSPNVLGQLRGRDEDNPDVLGIFPPQSARLSAVGRRRLRSLPWSNGGFVVSVVPHRERCWTAVPVPE